MATFNSPLAIIFCGSGEFGLPTLRALLSAGRKLVHVFTQPDRPAGRGRQLTPTPIGQFALAANLPLTRTADINAQPLPPADVMLVIAFGQKIGESAVHHARFGSINLHASRLPKYRGASPIHSAILSGETVTGNSIIRLAPKMDAGAVLAQSTVPIGELETAGELHDRLALDGATLMLGVLAQLANGTAVETPQDESQATAAPKLSRQATRIDWTQSAEKIARQIRGLYPWPGCRVCLKDAGGKERGRLTLVRARVTPPGPAPGIIDSTRRVGAGGASLEIIEVQPEGRKPMSLSSYRNGNPWEAGFSLESI